MVCEKTFKEFLQVCRDEISPQKMAIFASNVSEKKSDQLFQRTRTLRNFFMAILQVAPIHQSHVF